MEQIHESKSDISKFQVKTQITFIMFGILDHRQCSLIRRSKFHLCPYFQCVERKMSRCLAFILPPCAQLGKGEEKHLLSRGSDGFITHQGRTTHFLGTISNLRGS